MSKKSDNIIKKLPADLLKRSKVLEKLDVERLVKSQEKIWSQRKYKSGSKHNNNHPSFKVDLGTEDIQKSNHNFRIKTEHEENLSGRAAHMSHRVGEVRNPYLKLMGFKRKQMTGMASSRKQTSNLETTARNGSFFFNQKLHLDTAAGPNRKPIGRKRLVLNDSYMKNPGFVVETVYPLTGKSTASSKRKTFTNQMSEKSLKRKQDLEKYTSESLQKLEAVGSSENEGFRKSVRERTLDKRNRLIQEQGRIGSNEDGLSGTRKYDHEDKFRTKSNLQEKQRRIRTEVDEESYRPPSKTKHNNGNNTNLEIVFEKRKTERKNDNPYDLSREELEIFGDRFPESFQKIKLLGRGGFSLVWLGQHKKSKKLFAIKQIKTENNHQTHIKEIWFGTYFFEMGGVPKKEFAKHKGIKNLVKIYSYDINKSDTWIFYEKCGESLGNALYDLKGETYGSDRIYRSIYKPLYFRLKENQNEIRKIIIQVAKALQLLSENRIVHSDLKTENILVKVKEANFEDSDTAHSIIEELKLIDYGSSFTFNNLKQFSMATPEYMAPQILNYILYQNELDYAPKLLDYIKVYDNPWVIDVWSLGCVLLEIVSGIPLWMSLKTIVRKKGAQVVKYGLFAIKGRHFDKIIKKQIEVVQHLDQYLTEENYSGITLEPDLKTILKKMLSVDPVNRPSPEDIIAALSPACPG